MSTELLTDDDRIAYWQGAYERMAARNAELAAQRDQMLEAAKDALAGWRYIREHHGDLYGVGWDRVETSLSEALATSPNSPDKAIHR